MPWFCLFTLHSTTPPLQPRYTFDMFRLFSRFNLFAALLSPVVQYISHCPYPRYAPPSPHLTSFHSLSLDELNALCSAGFCPPVYYTTNLDMFATFKLVCLAQGLEMRESTLRAEPVLTRSRSSGNLHATWHVPLGGHRVVKVVWDAMST